MKRFRFPLETVLNLRRIRERQATQDLARCQRAVLDLDGQIRTLGGERQSQIEDLRAQLSHRPCVEALIAANAFLFATSKKLERQLQTLALFKVREARARTLWLEASSRRKAVDRLRERRLGEWRVEFSRQEQKAVDEVATGRAASRGRSGSVLTALGIVFAAALLVVSAFSAYLFSTGKLTLAGVQRAVTVLKQTPVAAPAKGAVERDQPVAQNPKEETALERAKRVQGGSTALMASVREHERHRERTREEMVAWEKLAEILREEIRGEIEDLKKQEVQLQKERQSIETARAQASAAKPVEAKQVPAGKFLQMIKTMRPAEIKAVLAPLSDEEVAKILATVDTRLAAKILREFMADPTTQGRVPGINDLLRGGTGSSGKVDQVHK